MFRLEIWRGGLDFEGDSIRAVKLYIQGTIQHGNPSRLYIQGSIQHGRLQELPIQGIIQYGNLSRL